jgi:hypothetical protein
VRVALALIAVAAALLVAGCGGSGGADSLGDATVTVPSNVSGIGGELKAILDQLPYQGWYTSCVERRFAAALGPGEEEALAALPEAEREKRFEAIVAKVGPACEKSTDRPLVDPNATSQELDLLRAELVPAMREIAESQGLDATQSECLTRAFENLPDRFIVAFGNGDQKARGQILLTVFKTCAASG